jgi:hypothetical protein
MTNVESLRAGDLQIDVVERDTVLLLYWLGMSNERQPEKVLKPFFATILAAAEAQKKLVELHFERIERFNSSTILCIIQLIQEARRREIRLTAVYDQTRKWQRLSFDALRIFAKADGLFTLHSNDEPVK